MARLIHRIPTELRSFLARQFRGEDELGYRTEFVRLAELASKLSR